MRFDSTYAAMARENGEACAENIRHFGTDVIAMQRAYNETREQSEAVALSDVFTLARDAARYADYARA